MHSIETRNCTAEICLYIWKTVCEKEKREKAMEIKTEMFIVNMHGVVRNFQFFESQVQSTDIFDYQLWIYNIHTIIISIYKITFQFSRIHTAHNTQQIQ